MNAADVDRIAAEHALRLLESDEGWTEAGPDDDWSIEEFAHDSGLKIGWMDFEDELHSSISVWVAVNGARLAIPADIEAKLIQMYRDGMMPIKVAARERAEAERKAKIAAFLSGLPA
jgi:hypothetical protein